MGVGARLTPKKLTVSRDHPVTGAAARHATPSDPSMTPEVVVRMAEIEAELRVMKGLVAEVRAKGDELRQDSRRMQARVKRLLFEQRRLGGSGWSVRAVRPTRRRSEHRPLRVDPVLSLQPHSLPS